MKTTRRGIPVEIVFAPNWWFENYGISFAEPFYFDRQRRIENDLLMRKALHERFGLGDPSPEPRPVIGSRHVAGGFVIPALLGVAVRFSDNQAPWNLVADRSREEILAMRPPEIETTWPMNRLIEDMDWLEREFGHVVGDFNTGGLINTGNELRGQQLFLDLVEDPELTDHLFGVIAETEVRVARYVKERTGTNSISVNRSIVNVDPALYVHSNCSVQMISPKLYERAVFPHERKVAAALRPFGVHHCGNNLQLYAELYSELKPAFCDVGWGSDVARVSETLPDTFLNLRLDPVRMLRATAAEIRGAVHSLLSACGRSANVGLCCINMDHATPDGNVIALLEGAAAGVPSAGG